MIPVKLILENFISHSYLEIDFTKFNVALIIGPNGCGKTAILDAIKFVLYGKVRFSKKEKAIKHGKLFCKVEFIFYINNDLYKIERTLNKKNGFMNVVFYKNENDKWESNGFTCDTPTITTSKIESLIRMSYDTFVNCINFGQNDISGFAGAKPSKRKEILKEILAIDFWDNLQEVAKNYEKNLIEQKNIISNRLLLLNNLDEDNNKINNELVIINKNIDNLNIEYLEIENKIKDYDFKINNLERDIKNLNLNDLKEKLDENLNKIEDIKIKRDLIKKEVQKNNEEISNANNDCFLLDKKLFDLSKNILISDNKYYDKAKVIFKKFSNDVPKILVTSKELSLLKDNFDKYISEKNIIDLQIKQLNLLEPSKECPTCLSIIDINEVNDKRDLKRDFLKEQKNKLEKKILDIDKVIKNYNNIIDKSNESSIEIERIELIIAKRMATISNNSKKNDNLKEKFNILALQWGKLKEEKNELENLINNGNLENYKNSLKNFICEKEKLVNELNILKNNIKNYNIQFGSLKNSLKEVERKISEKNILNEQQNYLNSEIIIYSELVKIFGKDGIQAIIMENVTEDLRNFTNLILKNICSEPISVDFSTQKKTINGVWKEDFNLLISIRNNEMDYEGLSGGEQVRISIALRLALSKLLMQRVGSNIKLLLLDEIDQALDVTSIEILADAIIALSNDFKILLITHNEIMKERFDYILPLKIY